MNSNEEAKTLISGPNLGQASVGFALSLVTLVSCVVALGMAA
ncbi:hypothetical protein ACFPQ7_20305 [Methylobacterium iners]|uniref:Uncharacterized protein n=1 Tax=Methylobacterium iners TaxID=418707 RepID=A0ABQ4S3K5_9HYPH|nr:hypothetical protein OCOJLMKI_4864 [Methylobacterium iners]